MSAAWTGGRCDPPDDEGPGEPPHDGPDEPYDPFDPDAVDLGQYGFVEEQQRLRAVDNAAGQDSDDASDRSTTDATTISSTTLPEEFWNARPSLRHIRKAAHNRNRSADVLLHALFARLASQEHPETRVHTGLGEAVLNMLCIVVGHSGAGKSTSIEIASELPETPLGLQSTAYYRDNVGVGSGEGIANLFMGHVEVENDEPDRGDRNGNRRREKVYRKVRSNASVYVDEGEQLFQIASRSGSTIMPTLRSAWSGQVLGQANASADTTRHIPAKSYCIGIVIGIQPVKAGPLFGDAAGGTPQRCLFSSTTDPNVPEDFVAWPGPLPINRGYLRREITMDDSIKWRIRKEDRQVTWGQIVHDELDSHQPLHLIKVSALLATIDGRDHVTEQDWALAEQVWTTSCAVRTQVVDQISQALAQGYARSDEREAHRRVKVEDAKVEAVTTKTAKQEMAAAKSIARKVNREGTCKKRELTQAVNGKYRREYKLRTGDDLVAVAIDLALQNKWIAEVEDGAAYERGSVNADD